MANLIRSAKSGSSWTLNKLDSYNIHLERQEAPKFFGVPLLQDPADRNAELINLLDLAMLPTGSGETAVVDFAVELLKHTGYVRRNQVARTRRDLPLLICGKRENAKADVCIVNRQQNDIILLVQEGKRIEDVEPIDARAQLVANALAAFPQNNASRENCSFSPLESKVIPGIVMIGTSPTFFKIPVTKSS
ncbi:hypothetical protein FA13DRAFT_1791390 [Coprinellus micaceus]|uniref:Uncharacterized protein n=1 Tax=Coprinellus micaceus TaxID=71717 RepID=A0A4Y7TBV0_COPMI|nr:hypothetical protein FA13DRAFT_1791390 [Coprinellus micaceus]